MDGHVRRVRDIALAHTAGARARVPAAAGAVTG